MIVALTLLAGSAQAAPMLEITGECPGPVSILINDATPDGKVAVLTADGLGLGGVPAGSCAGTRLDINSVGLSLRKIKNVNGSGDGVIIVDLPAGVCGSWMQLLDLDTCETSHAAKLASREVTFRYTGADRDFTLDPGVTTVEVIVDGGAGGDGGAEGGGGASIRGPMSVYSGETLTLSVGSAGQSGTGTVPGGYGGGGTYHGAGALGGAGGGSSHIERQNGEWDLLAAGGGGGGWYAVVGNGGDGGLDGGDGRTIEPAEYPGGKGATLNTPGAGGGDGEDGALFGYYGGDCFGSTIVGCGAGGGGWHGGGGGDGGGGGAGSSLVNNGGTRMRTYRGAQRGDGRIILRW